ncbi:MULTISPECIES: Maf family protein [Gordonia]|uniref:Nucleoside triphosphate pyrophosphatase n=2 Tax=Gordonia TaxID=2053 RepID=A0AAW4G2Y7_GORRU|nr:MULTISPECIES: Maf family nucleotide pyrophosphatase [Gordonia]AZZ82848.1 septum formation inhibitor Maf [Gordonia alkanivorans]ETA08844.1 septum formation protein Maf [Gordonia alkanivorans CGMCC 6845]MBM7277589.1 septum formation inhibitor Maf [Gordonia rubripertincta]MDH3005510.1 Maf family nucleotide pyrophosphatase [Gordonia alkanivorans]MDH3010194.1 Maf family nucleotide pyrophosphatase [Gordonia alkanivorans]
MPDSLIGSSTHETGPATAGPVFVLGSASPARLRVLRAAGVEPVVRVSDVDEDAVLAQLPPGTPADAVVAALARAKAEAVASLPEIAGAAQNGETVVVIGCDSMLLLGDRLLGKPHTPERALAQWAEMRGRSADLLTGHHLIRLNPTTGSATATGTSSTTIHFTDAHDDVIARYVDSGEPLQVAGAFTLDGLGGWLVERIDGDPSSVIGIGLPLVQRLLTEVGLSVTDFWLH